MTTVSIYDIENRYVGFSGSFSNVVSVVCEYGSVFVLANKGEQLFQLTEKDTQSKLDILFKKNEIIKGALEEGVTELMEQTTYIRQHTRDGVSLEGNVDKDRR